MDFSLTKPCKNCPFNTDTQKGWLGRNRATEIAASLVRDQKSFPCHKTTHGNIDKEQHCAGAMIMLEKFDRPNQMMRIMEQLGLYDRTKLDMDADVFDTPSEFIERHA